MTKVTVVEVLRQSVTRQRLGTRGEDVWVRVGVERATAGKTRAVRRDFYPRRGEHCVRDDDETDDDDDDDEEKEKGRGRSG